MSKKGFLWMFFSTSSHLQWFFLEDAKKKEMTTCISTLSNNKKFLGSLFFPLKKEKIDYFQSYFWVKKNDLLTWLLQVIYIYKTLITVSLTSKVSDGYIRDLEFNPRLYQKLIGVLVWW